MDGQPGFKRTATFSTILLLLLLILPVVLISCAEDDEEGPWARYSADLRIYTFHSIDIDFDSLSICSSFYEWPHLTGNGFGVDHPGPQPIEEVISYWDGHQLFPLTWDNEIIPDPDTTWDWYTYGYQSHDIWETGSRSFLYGYIENWGSFDAAFECREFMEIHGLPSPGEVVHPGQEIILSVDAFDRERLISFELGHPDLEDSVLVWFHTELLCTLTVPATISGEATFAVVQESYPWEPANLIQYGDEQMGVSARIYQREYRKILIEE